MRILIACEFSGVVRDAFAAKGHDAWSCDLEPSERDGQHLHGNVLYFLKDGFEKSWDMMVAFPPCTHLCVSGARWFKDKRREQTRAVEFFSEFVSSCIPKIAIENPALAIRAWGNKIHLLMAKRTAEAHTHKRC